MIDMSMMVAPKVDQLTADDLLGGPRTITITKVTGNENADQPVNLHFEGDDGKPFRPCKTLRRVLLYAWGKYANEYVGRSMTVYRDGDVQFGGLAVGGIRISHLSHIDGKLMLAVTAKKGKKKPYEVMPLKAEVHQHPTANEAAFARSPHEEASKEQVALHQRTAAWATKYIAAVQDAVTEAELKGVRERQAEKLAWVRDNFPAIYSRVIESDPHSAAPGSEVTGADNQAGDEGPASPAQQLEGAE